MSEADLPWVLENEQELHPFPWTRGNFADCLTAGYSAWVMHHADRPVGYAVMLTVLDEAHLLNISIARPAQRKGFGSLLLQYLFAVARRLGSTQFFLEVRPSNASAQALYARHAFIAVGRRRHYYPAADGMREDAIVMRRDL